MIVGDILSHRLLHSIFSFSVLGFLLQAIFIAAVGYAKSQQTAVMLLTMGVGMGGLVWSGFSVNIIDIAPRYAGLLMGISNCIATVPGIVGPPIAGALTPNEVYWKLYYHIIKGTIKSNDL